MDIVDSKALFSAFDQRENRLNRANFADGQAQRGRGRGRGNIGRGNGRRAVENDEDSSTVSLYKENAEGPSTNFTPEQKEALLALLQQHEAKIQPIHSVN
ncbi:hypothetical protein HN873_070918 [Arachis hypogaea]|nr:uncharacterized protein DS421_20g692180 [Arachis hypogaea]